MKHEWIGKTLWEDRRKQDTDRLQKLVPSQGRIHRGQHENRKLELFRLFMNAYYDLYNNGGGNWHVRGQGYRAAAKFYKFRIMSVRDLRNGIDYDQNACCEELEKLGDAVINGALVEQWDTIGDVAFDFSINLLGLAVYQPTSLKENPKLNEEIQAWCDENLHSKWFFEFDIDKAGAHFVMWFSHLNDATLFKLRWSEKIRS